MSKFVLHFSKDSLLLAFGWKQLVVFEVNDKFPSGPKGASLSQDKTLNCPSAQELKTFHMHLSICRSRNYLEISDRNNSCTSVGWQVGSWCVLCRGMKSAEGDPVTQLQKLPGKMLIIFYISNLHNIHASYITYISLFMTKCKFEKVLRQEIKTIT